MVLIGGKMLPDPEPRRVDPPAPNASAAELEIYVRKMFFNPIEIKQDLIPLVDVTGATKIV